MPVIAGGTGLFIDSFVDNISFSSANPDEELRARLSALDEDELYSRLLQTDPRRGAKTHKTIKSALCALLKYIIPRGNKNRAGFAFKAKLAL